MNSKSLKYILLASIFTAVSAHAAPPNTPILDGQPIEYDDVDFRASSTNSNNSFGPGNVLTNLFVTWDETHLYIALQGAENDNKLTILLDADPGNGTGASGTTNWTGVEPSFIKYNDVAWQVSSNGSATPFGLDYMIASEGFFNSMIRVSYDGEVLPDTNTNVEVIFDNGNGAAPTGGDIDMVVKADGSANDLKGIEAKIAWADLYITNGRFGVVSAGEVVPSNATIRLLAILHNNDPVSAYSSDGIIPNQTSVNSSYAAGLWTSDDYVDVVIDSDSNGIPDVAAGDVNAPYLKFLSGVQSNTQVFAWFNEDVETNSAQNVANWRVGADNPESITVVQSDAVILNLSNALPTAGTLVRVQAAEVEDADSNSRTTYNYFDPANSGISTAVTVRFFLEKNSGMGKSTQNPRVTTNLFVNGNLAPLEFGYPPAVSSPLTMLNNTQFYRDVTFPPGTSTDLRYKYSGILDGGGNATDTNNYEAVRLVNYSDAARELTLPTDGTSFLVVTDYLGAAAGPYNDPTSNGFEEVYFDDYRGDAGVRDRVEMLFTLDLSQRNLAGVSRVLILGSDPLRGFNNSAEFYPADFTDFPGNEVGVTWLNAGLTMNDAGTDGDETADDGIYSLLWAATADGTDSTLVPGSPNSLVGGENATKPYQGFWEDRRSPRSFIYKFYVYKSGTDTALESPSSDIEVYLGEAETNVVFGTHLWDNAELPLPPPSNSPTMLTVEYNAGTGTATFENEESELQHGYHVSTNLLGDWMDFGGRAATTMVSGVWAFNAESATETEHYRAFAGPPKPFEGVTIDPYPIPQTGATVRIYYTQHSRGLAGDRNVQIAGNFTSWSPAPMTFMGDGVWYYDLDANTNVFANTLIKFKPRNLSGSFWDGLNGGGDDYFAYVGDLRASYSSTSPTNGELWTLTYDAFGGPLAASTNVNVHMGFDEDWFDAGQRTMTNTLGNTNIWELAFPVPSNASLSINFVFTDGTSWDSEGAAPPNGRQWRIFIDND